MKRDLLRNEAKKLYKEQIKGIPKRQRLPFAQFFKQYKMLKAKESAGINTSDQPEDDFDFGELVNEISDEDLVTEETVVEANNEEEV